MINNTGFLVARDGVSAIDSCATERRTRAFLDAIARVTAAPVRTLVNTHHHPDHTAGNGLFSGAAIVAHEQARPEMRALGLPHNSGIWTDVDYGDLELALPFLTFADRMTLWADDLRVRAALRRRARPHHQRRRGVDARALGALRRRPALPRRHPVPALGLGARRHRRPRGVRRPLGAQTIVPGHGPVGGPAMIDEVLGYLRFVRDVAADGHAAGVTPLELARGTDLGAYAEWTDTERIVGNLHRAYADLTVPVAERGGPIDFPGALGDMVTFNGGRPLTCLA